MATGRDRPLYVWITGFSISGVIFLVGLIVFLVYGCKRWKENKQLKLRRMELESEMAINIDKQEVKAGTSGHTFRGSSRVGVINSKESQVVAPSDSTVEQETIKLSESSRIVTFQVPKTL
ncbi:uncharacterized protein LOC110452414 [Mizuhopecten yessoensis]|uniref:uncharacterized protein LOC110452414 n=1 Tax=Mizuhopecten yessoensis TaxID=6573 RepID=UPI000B45C8E8|nr:uncharacterized protein LOC110452414 [Mizuhopecten yessoensis]